MNTPTNTMHQNLLVDDEKYVMGNDGKEAGWNNAREKKK